MINILHGDNLIASRNLLNSFITQAGRKKISLIKLSDAGFQIDQLVSAIEPDLFSQEKLIVIDDFQKFSFPTQKEIAQTIKKLSPKNSIIIWSAKKLPQKVLKLFPQHQERLFKPSNQVFIFLDAFQKGNRGKALKYLNQTLKKEDPGLVYYLLSNRIEDLIIAKTNHLNQLKKAPWQKSRLVSQAEKFTLPELKFLLEALVELDYQQKIGQLPYPLTFGLELLAAKL